MQTVKIKALRLQFLAKHLSNLRMKHYKSELVVLISIIFTFAVTLFVLSNRNKTEDTRVYSAEVPVYSTPVPIPQSSVPTPSLTNIFESPDGKVSLTVRKEMDKNTTNYSFFLSEGQNADQKYIFSRSENVGQSITIPYNTWSPDNLFFYLVENVPGNKNYLVFYSTGKIFANNLPYINISELFRQKFPDLILTDITGWGGLNLLVVNTNNKDGTLGYSYWFDMSNFSFIRLSTRFN